MSGKTLTQHSSSGSERALKLLTLFSLLLIAYLVSGQQPLQDSVRQVLNELRPVRQGDPRLVLTGTSLNTGSRTAVINGRVLAEGEIATVQAGPNPLTLRVLRVDRDAATVSIEGEHQVRVLSQE